MCSSTPSPRFPRGIAWRLFLTCWVLYALHLATNTVREIYPALALGDHLRFDVSEYLGLHPDIFELPGRGVFINNNPGASVLGAIPYALTRPLIDRVSQRAQQRRRAAGEVDAVHYDSVYPMARDFYRKARTLGLDVKFGLAAGVMQVLAMAPVSALSVVVMYWVLLSLTRSPRAALLLALLYGFATPVFYRTAQLNENLLVAHAAFFAFVMLWQPWVASTTPTRPRYLGAGLLTGWAVVCDYSGVVVVAVLSVYAWLRRRALPPQARAADDLWRFAAGVGTGVAVLWTYQWACFGNPFYPAQQYMPAAHFSDQGYKGMAWPSLDLLWATGFDLRFGLFISAPLLLLALYPPAWGRAERLLGALETWCIAAFCALFFVFCSANQYGRMQFFCGVRHVMPVVPFLSLIVAGVLWHMPVRRAVMVGVVTAYWSWCLAMYRDVEFGYGVLESVKHISLEGPRLPWLHTLEGLGYVQRGVWATPVLVFVGIGLAGLWATGQRSTGRLSQSIRQDA